MNDSQPESLAGALADCQIALPEDQMATLDAYRLQLWSWNERLNLTRHTDYARFVARDVVDSLELARHLAAGERILDIGTGGGVPGVILAIVRDDLRVTLSESVAKKARAVEEIVAELKLPIKVRHARAEELLAVSTYDSLVARAVAPLRKLLSWLGPHWGAFDRLLAIKGRSWIEERAEARHHGLFRDIDLRCLATYRTPNTNAESVVLEMKHRLAQPDPI